jgi:hypothetical protein
VNLRRFAGCCALFSASILCARHASVPDGVNKEEIYVIRSVRTSRIPPTDYCAQSRTGFAETLFEDRFAFHTVSTNTKDGLVANAFGAKTGSGNTCFGKTVDPDVLNFYAEGEIAGISFKGRGRCTILKKDFPEAGLNVSTCFLDLGGLQDRYAGGLLTSNTLVSRDVTGDKSDPPGYLQSSIATVRLWRRR